ncbi:MAG: hypothetical protein ACTSQY_00405 [Candidatus Odinarchaeia archaeon]|nr:MAG: hypothetical protein [Lokiarchaeota virus Fenrir Meg22_1012]URC17262.1 MAG: hypothetical protein [Lokiarchaeota virus Fenrir Meg22_1214]
MINPEKWLENNCFFIERMYLNELCAETCWEYAEGDCDGTPEERRNCKDIEVFKKSFSYKTYECFIKFGTTGVFGEIVITNCVKTIAFVLNFDFEKYKKEWNSKPFTPELWKSLKKWTYEPIYIRWALKLTPNAEIWLSNEERGFPLIIKNDVGAFLIAPKEVE